MAPSFDQLSDHDFDDEEEEIDFSDLRDQYEVRMEEGLDTFVVRKSLYEARRMISDTDRSSMVSP